MKIFQNSTGDNITKEEVRYFSILGAVFILSFLYIWDEKTQIVEAKEISSLEEFRLKNEMTDSRVSYFYEGLDTKARSIVVFDTLEDQPLYEKNPKEIMPLASLVKIMTGVVALENIEEDEIIKIKKSDLSQIGDNGLLVDEKWNAKDLIGFTLITSSNDGARAIATHIGNKFGGETEEDALNIFTRLMNEKAASLNLANTIFYNESGLDVTSELNGGYSSAFEIVKLFSYAISNYPEVFSSTSFNSQNFKSLSDLDHQAMNTNQTTGQVAGISASKTGFTNLSGGNLIVSFKAGEERTVIVVALGSTFTERFTDIEKLANTTINVINEVQL